MNKSALQQGLLILTVAGLASASTWYVTKYQGEATQIREVDQNTPSPLQADTQDKKQVTTLECTKNINKGRGMTVPAAPIMLVIDNSARTLQGADFDIGPTVLFTDQEIGTYTVEEPFEKALLLNRATGSYRITITTTESAMNSGFAAVTVNAWGQCSKADGAKKF